MAALFAEIVENCPNLEGIHFMIAPSTAPHSLVEGYEIHLSGKTFDKQTIDYLQSLANERHLAFENSKESVGIYQARTLEEALEKG